MTSPMATVVHPVKDLAAARRLYATLLGTEPYVDQPWYVGFRVGGVELGLDPNGHAQGSTGPVAFWPVSDIAAAVEALQSAGAEIRRPAADVGGGRLVATLADPEGNPFGLVQSP